MNTRTPRTTWGHRKCGEACAPMSMALGRRAWLVLAVSVGFLVVLFLLCIDIVPKRDLTLGNISSLGLQVHSFYEANHRLPSNLQELKAEPRFKNDAWGRPITYRMTSSNSYTLRSLGPRGKPGKDNMVYSFDARDLSGTPAQ
jgi:hypothetical protein